MTDDLDDPRAWASYAEDDLRLARLAANDVPPIAHGACFHSQQAAEKYLKAFLVERRVVFPRTHDLILLLKLCEQYDSTLASLHDACDALNEFGSPVRYPPAGIEFPSEHQARQSVELAAAVSAFIRERLKDS
jgi:HEPN domain-containing protein